MDISIRMSEKIVHRDISGLFQMKEISFELTEKDVPEAEVRTITLDLRYRVKKLIVNTKLLEGLITAEQGIDELAKYVEVTHAK